MPDHDKLLLVFAIVFGIVVSGMIVIDWLFARKDDQWMPEFEAPDHLAEGEIN